jgi:RHS repeat-associated protein
VQYGTWTSWLTHTSQTEAPFVGERDQSYYFRVQATDNVNNTSAWVEAGPVTVSTVTKYYYHGDQRVAMRQGDVVYFLHSDHLGSTSLTTDQSGAPVAETRYLPYGEERWTSGGAVSDYTFTGQRVERGFGLMDYNARYYDPGLGRFVSADMVVPQAGNPQALNRYAYVLNNPIVYIDPSGHCLPEECPGVPDAEYIGWESWGGYTGQQRIEAEIQQIQWLEREEAATGGMLIGGSSIRGLQEAVAEDLQLVLMKEGPDALYEQFYQELAQGASLTGAHLASGTADFMAAGGSAALISAIKAAPNVYSVAYEVELPNNAYPGRSRGYHNQVANQNLIHAMDVDPAFASAMNDLIPGIQEQLVGPEGGVSRRPPSDWTWHHDYWNSGVVQLVPRSQHEASEFQSLFHPGGLGGYATWGK